MRRVSTIVSAPGDTAISVAEAKSHSNITFSDDDTLIGVYINAATAKVEQELQRKLITQTWKMFLDSWPPYIDVLFGDLQSVTHIKYTDIDDTQTTYSSDNYYTDTDSVPGRIVLKESKVWPSDHLRAMNPIEIQFVTGYGDASSDVPDDIRLALMQTVAHMYENRETHLVSEMQNLAVMEVPDTAKQLLQHHRVWRWVL